MQTGKQNKNIRSAMDGLTDIPEGYTFNNKRVWNALEQELTGNRKGRKQMYYAAAVVIGLIGAASLYFMQSTPLNHPAIKTEAVVKEKQPGTTVIQVAPVAGTIKRVKRMETISSPAHKKIAPTKESATETDVTATTWIEKSIENPVENIVLPALSPVLKPNEKKTIQSTTATKPKARRYTVVHLNDLEPGNTTTPPQSNLSRSEFKKIIQQQQGVEKEPEQTAPDNPIRAILFLKRAAATTSIIENN